MQFVIGFTLGAGITAYTLIRRYNRELDILNEKAKCYKEMATRYQQDNFKLMNKVIKLED